MLVSMLSRLHAIGSLNRTPKMISIAPRPWWFAVLSLTIAAAACERDTTRPQIELPASPAPPLAALQCAADVKRGSVQCSPTSSDARFQQQIIGGQGIYVRLHSANASYAGGVFSFDVAVQNLSTLAFATADGATRDPAGVRVFFHGNPTATSGTGAITVANPTGTGTFTGAGQPYFQYGGQLGGVDQTHLGNSGILGSGSTSVYRNWQFNVPATVITFSFVLYVSTQTPAGNFATIAPQVTGITPAVMVPGEAATITGINFENFPGFTTVTIGGMVATITGDGPGQIQVTVPCVASGNVPVQVTSVGKKGAPFAHPLQVANQRSLGVGQAAIASAAGEAECNEISATGAPSRYVVAVYNASTSPLSTAGFRISGEPNGAGPNVPAAALAPARSTAIVPRVPGGAPPSLDAHLERARALRAGEAHYALLEKSREAGERLHARFASDARMRPMRSVTADPVPPPPARTFRVSNINATYICENYYTVSATRVYYNGKVAIYEDNAVASGLKAVNNAAMAGYYTRIGDTYNASMEPVLTSSFGNPIRRDAHTDNNGVLVMLFTPLINTTFPALAGFVVPCDQYPNDEGAQNYNTASNFGEYFYARVPSVTGSGYFSGETPDAWFRGIQGTIIHEAKHVASLSARVEKGAQPEVSWLEEGTARHAEELWVRQAVYGVAWKGNTGYGSAAAPGSLYCDVRPTVPACAATSPYQPTLGMVDHFFTLYTFMDSPDNYSPFGRIVAGDFTFYAASWSLVRYAIDRYGNSDATFLGALNESSSTGADNLAARADVPIEQLLGGWALALYTDDYPGLAAPSIDLQIPTWNFTSIYSGMNADFPGSFPLDYPLTPMQLGFGAFAQVTVPSLPGGGVAYFELSGTQTQPQILRLQSTGGGAPPSTLRIAIARLQ